MRVTGRIINAESKDRHVPYASVRILHGVEEFDPAALSGTDNGTFRSERDQVEPDGRNVICEVTHPYLHPAIKIAPDAPVVDFGEIAMIATTPMAHKKSTALIMVIATVAAAVVGLLISTWLAVLCLAVGLGVAAWLCPLRPVGTAFVAMLCTSIVWIFLMFAFFLDKDWEFTVETAAAATAGTTEGGGGVRQPRPLSKKKTAKQVDEIARKQCRNLGTQLLVMLLVAGLVSVVSSWRRKKQHEK